MSTKDPTLGLHLGEKVRNVSLDRRRSVANDPNMLTDNISYLPKARIPSVKNASQRRRTLRTASYRALLLAAVFGASACWEVPVNELVIDGSVSPDGGSGDMSTGGDGSVDPGPVGWRWESPIPQGNNLRALWGAAGKSSDQDDLFMGGEAGTLVTGRSTGWKVQRSPSSGSRTILGMSGYLDNGVPQAFGVGMYDLSLLYSNSQWSDQTPYIGTGDGQLTGVWASPTPGEFFTVGTTGRVYKVTKNGTKLSFSPEAMGVTTDSLFAVSGVAGPSAPDVYAVGANGRILHRGLDGKWLIEANGMAAQQLNAVWVGTGPLAGDVFAAGDGGLIMRKTGGSWSFERPPTTANLTALWGVGDELFAVGAKGTLMRRKAGAWQVEANGLTTELLSALWGTDRGTGSVTVYAVGNLGTILRRERDTWTQVSSRVTSASLASVWAASPAEAYAVGSDGLIIKRAGAGALGSWKIVPNQSLVTLNAVSGYIPSAGDADVWAVGAEGTILHQAGSVWVVEGGVLGVAELTGVWVGSDAVFVVGRGGRIYSKLQGNWNIEQGPMGPPITDDLFAAWGMGSGDARVVYVAGSKGVILRRDKNGWTQEGSGLTSETIVSIVGSTEEGLSAVGNKGTILRRAAGKWTSAMARPLVQSGASGVAACSVPKSTDLWVVGTQGVIMRNSGSDWSAETSLTNQPFTGVGCGSTTDIFVVGPSGLILHKY